MPGSADVGQRCLTPMVSETNGGVDYSVALITEVGSTTQNGIMVNIQRLNNGSLGVWTYVEDVEFVDYEPDARDLGVDNGAWPGNLA